MSNQNIPSLDSLLEHRSWVRAVARRLLRDEHAAEDLAQEAWARALRSPPDPDRDPRPWLRRVLKNLASNRYRSDSRRQRRETAWRDDRVQLTPAQLVAEAEQHRRLVGHVLDLEEPFKTTLVLRFYDGLGPKEIAERLGIPVGTVHSRIARATERLKQRLDGEEGGDRRAWIAAFVPLAGFERVLTAATASAMTTSLTGILIMTLTKPKFALLLLLLLGSLAGGAFWLAADTPGADLEAPSIMQASDERAPGLEGRGAPLRATPAASVETDAAPLAGSGHLVRGRVVDERGQPVEQAEVFLLPRGAAGATVEELRDPRLGRLRTGADGRFKIRVDDMSGVRLVAFVAGHLSTSVEPSVVDEGPIELVVGDPWQLAVEVADAAGHWPRGCSLRVFSDLDATFERAADAALQEFDFDIDPWEPPTEPRVVIPVTTRARLQVEVRPPERMAAVPAVQYVEHPQAEVRVRLIPSGSLRLDYVDGVSGGAVAEGARVSVVIRRESTGAISHSVSAIKPDFDFDSGFSPGRYAIQLGVVGYRKWERVVELHDVGERVELVARLVPDTGMDGLGQVILQVTDPHRASKALRTLLESGAPPGFSDQYRLLLRRAGSDSWIHAWTGALAGGRGESVRLSLQTSQSEGPGLRPGTWDFFIARRDTGTAAFLQAVRIFGDQKNVVDVTLKPGTAFRLSDVARESGRFTDIKVRTQAAGGLPPILWGKNGSTWITAESGIAWLLRLPRKPVVLGPFPGEEIEVRLTGEDGSVRTVRVRGAGVVDRSAARK